MFNSSGALAVFNKHKGLSLFPNVALIISLCLAWAIITTIIVSYLLPREFWSVFKYNKLINAGHLKPEHSLILFIVFFQRKHPFHNNQHSQLYVSKMWLSYCFGCIMTWHGRYCLGSSGWPVALAGTNSINNWPSVCQSVKLVIINEEVESSWTDLARGG